MTYILYHNDCETTRVSLDEILPKRNRTAIIERMRWIDERLYWVGRFRRSVYAERFGLSINQITSDFSLYEQLSSSPLRDEDRWILPTIPYTPVFDGERNLDSWISSEPSRTRVISWDEDIVPSKWLDMDILQAVLNSSETATPLLVSYASMSSGEEKKRVLCPHAIVRAGGRYHVRAWDDLRSRFADFVIGRMSNPELRPKETWVSSKADNAWNENVDVHIGPHPDLDEFQRGIVCDEWGIEDSATILQSRRALLLYFLDSLQLLDAVKAGHGCGSKMRGICCLNSQSLAAALED